MKYLKLYENKNIEEYYVVATSSYPGSINYKYQWENEFDNQEEVLEWIFSNYYVDIDPDPDFEWIEESDKRIYGKDIKVVKVTIGDADIEEELNNFKMKAQSKKYNL